VLAGTTAIEQASGMMLPFCGGRTDAVDGMGSNFLKPNGNYTAAVPDVYEEIMLMGLSNHEAVALAARLRSPSQLARSGYNGSYTTNPTMLSNTYFIELLSENWMPSYVGGNGQMQYKAQGKDLYMLPRDMVNKWDTTFLAISQEFAANNTIFMEVFARGWTRLMNMDRFNGPTGNLCEVPFGPWPPQPESMAVNHVPLAIGVSVACTFVFMLASFIVWYKCCSAAAKDKEHSGYVANNH